MIARRLILRVYLVTLAQFISVALAFYLLRQALLRPPPPPPGGHWEVYAARRVLDAGDDPQTLRAELERTRSELGVPLTLYAEDGTLIASSHIAPLPPLPASALGELATQRRARGPLPGIMGIALPGRGPPTTYAMVNVIRPPPPPPFGISVPLLAVSVILLLVLIGSALFARTLAHPLGRIAAVARAFGAGQLDARTGIDRRDELGDVARAFDEMATRVTQLLRAQRELLANVSHELRTPLARIRVALDLAAEGDADAARAALVDITHDWSDLERLVEDVLAAARLELGPRSAGPALRIEPVDLTAILERTAARFRLVHPQYPMVLDVPASLPAIAADAALLRRVLDNLLDNARKYSEPDTVVGLRARADPSGVVVEISDHGIGVDAGDLPNLFTPFFRGDRSRTRATGGVGLGLALARRIVEAHGGTIAIASVVGEGTTVTFRLPLLSAATPRDV